MTPRLAARLRATTACVGAAVAASALPLVAGGVPVRPQLTLAVAALVALGAGLAGWSPGITVAAVALAGEYLLRLHGREVVDALTVVEAALLFATVELGLRALEARSFRARREPAVRRAAALRLAVSIAGAALSAVVVLLLGSRPLPAPTAGLALGLTATVGVVVAADLVRRRVSG